MSPAKAPPPAPSASAPRSGQRPRAVLRSTPMRITLALVALFTLASAGSLAASYLVTRASVAEALRADLREEVAGFNGAPTAGAVADLVAAEAAATDPRRRILSYVAPDGSHYGNGVLAAGDEGFRLFAIDRLNIDQGLPYLALTVRLRGGWLTVASSQGQIEDLRRTYVTLLLLSLLPTIAIALAGGVIIARRTRRRIDAIGGVLDQLAAGDLAARVPPGRHGIDDLTLIGTRVNGMAAAQQASVEALRQVSADIAHDLKTPIQRVAVLLQRMIERPDLPPEAEELAGRAIGETEAIVATFHALLQIAQIEGGSPRARFAPVDLSQLAATFVEVYEPATEDSGHALTLDLPAGPALVSGEKALLGQVIANLIENALRHTPAGARVAVSVRQGAGEVELAVADSGPGIPAEEHAHVLRRLYRLERSRTTPGNGLGLSLVASIAELHGARLLLEDAGPGLRVRLLFRAA